MARPRELANILGALEGIDGKSPEQILAIASVVGAVIPKVIEALGFLESKVAGNPDLEAELDAAIARASARNRSADVEEDLEAELDALQKAQADDRAITDRLDREGIEGVDATADTDKPPAQE